MEHDWISIQEEHMQGKSTQQARQYTTLFFLLFCKSKEGIYLNSQDPTGTVAAVSQVHNCT